MTPLEELVVEVRGDDDHGVDRLELVYAAAGRPERVVALHPGGAPTSVSGSGTVYVEDLEVEPGDFITFYARARDVARGRRPTEVQSDIFFLEVRPFSEEFQLAQTQAFQGAGGNVDDLAARQKEIVIATWKVERRAVAGRSPADIAAIARAQRELRDRALRSAESLAGLRPARRRGGEPRPEEAPQPGADDPKQRATAAMEVAAIELGSMIWFGSSAGVAIINEYEEPKDTWRWLKEGWHVPVAYILGFGVLYFVLGWHPEPIGP